MIPLTEAPPNGVLNDGSPMNETYDSTPPAGDVKSEPKLPDAVKYNPSGQLPPDVQTLTDTVCSTRNGAPAPEASNAHVDGAFAVIVEIEHPGRDVKQSENDTSRTAARATPPALSAVPVYEIAHPYCVP